MDDLVTKNAKLNKKESEHRAKILNTFRLSLEEQINSSLERKRPDVSQEQQKINDSQISKLEGAVLDPDCYIVKQSPLLVPIIYVKPHARGQKQAHSTVSDYNPTPSVRGRQLRSNHHYGTI